MSGKLTPSRIGESLPLSELFRFSSRPNRAHTIVWRTWGEEAFQEAVQQDKPIFLVITSSWCQWCHIMDETTLSQESVIAVVNNDYIPIRVDSDMRPDVNARYNQNGWPSVVLLSSEGEVLWGGVYMPAKQMLYYLGHIRRYYSEHHAEIAQQVQELRTSQQFTSSLAPLLPNETQLPYEKQTVLREVPEQAGLVLRDLYDAEYGGFTLHQHLKFPHPEALELLLQLARHESVESQNLLAMVSYSLEQMRDGGLWDNEEGGFFRYSAASDWSTPHTEKMLEENAAMLHLLLLTAQTTKDAQWYDLARRLILYCNTTLWQPEKGVFSGSQSADEEYYEPALYSRGTRTAPSVDTTVYISWNARMISTYLLASQILQNSSLAAMALTALDWLCEHMIASNGSVYHYAVYDSVALAGQLSDSVWLLQALLDAYEQRKITKYLERAMKLVHFACQELFDTESGLFYDLPYDEHALGRLVLRMQPLTENALMAQCLLQIAAISEDHHDLHNTGIRVLTSCLEQYRRTGIQGATYASVVLHAIEQQWL